MKKSPKDNIGFKLRKKVANTSVRLLPWLGALVGLSQISAVGVKYMVLTDEAGAKNEAVSMAAAQAIENDISKLDNTTREYFHLKAKKDPTTAQQKQIASLEKTAKALPASISHRIISDKNLSEEDAKRVLYSFNDMAKRAPVMMGDGLSYKQREAIPDVLVALRNGLPYLDDCRAAGKSDDAIVSCAVAKTDANDHAADMAHIGILVGLPFSVMGFSFAGMAMRRRVDKEEAEIKQDQFKASVDDLRNILAPKTPPRKDR